MRAKKAAERRARELLLYNQQARVRPKNDRPVLSKGTEWLIANVLRLWCLLFR